MAKGLPGRRWLHLALATVGISLLVYASSDGPPSQVTGGFGEPTCTDCHIGTGLNTGPGSVTITAPGTYASGQTYQITVRVADPNQRRWGFELSARTQGGQQAGSLISTPGQTQLVPSFNGIQYMAHTTAPVTGVGAGFTFTFNWQAPNVSAGSLVFHAAGNAANNSGSELGDRIYATSFTSQPEASGPAPTVLDGGTVNAASFVPHPNAVAPGSIVAIFGNDMTQGGQSAPESFFDSNNRLTTSLAGARVTMNGFSAPLFAAFPGQLNAQVPFELAGSTSASLQVTVAGQTSTPRTVFIDSTGPGIFLAPTSASATQGVILNASDNSVAAPAGSIVGGRPARRGQDILVIYCTGLGEVNPPLATGARAATHTTVQPVTVLIDGVAVAPAFAGLTPTLVGLNQVNVALPAGTRTGNNIPVVLMISGKSSNAATIAVGP